MQNAQNSNVDLLGSINFRNWYKKWWAWLLIIIVIVVIAVIGFNIKSNHASNEALHKTYHVGQTINYKGLSLKVDRIYYWNGNDINTPDHGKRYVMTKITAKNNANKSKNCDDYSFKLDDNGTNHGWDDYLNTDAPHENRNFGSDNNIDPGHSKTGFLYGQAKKGDKIALTYYPSTLNDSKKITVDLN